jgi:hypothetical protein
LVAIKIDVPKFVLLTKHERKYDFYPNMKENKTQRETHQMQSSKVS